MNPKRKFMSDAEYAELVAASSTPAGFGRREEADAKRQRRNGGNKRAK